MCDFVLLPDQPKPLRSWGELAEAGFVVLPEDYTQPEWEAGPDDCLCVVDVEAILDRSGLMWERDPLIGYYVKAAPR